MNRTVAFVAIAIAAVVAVAVAAFALRPLAPGGGVVRVVIADYSFSASDLTIRSGTTVQWVNMDHVYHTVTFGGHDEHGSGVDSGPMGHMGRFSYTFTEPGTYEYHCDPHPYMTGTIVVTA